MTDAERVAEFLREYGIKTSGDVIISQISPKSFFVPLSLSSGSDVQASPTRRMLAELRHKLTLEGYDVEFVIVDEGSRQIKD